MKHLSSLFLLLFLFCCSCTQQMDDEWELDEQERVIGAHVLGNPASEIITLAGTAIELGLTATQWKKIVFPHPTVGEIFREAL